MANEKMSYEDLEKVNATLEAKVSYLENQGKAMMGKIKELSDFLVLRRLEFLFKVIENDAKFGSHPDFVLSCTDEIVNLLTVPETEEEK